MVYYVPIKFENITSTLVQGLEKGICSIKYIPKGRVFVRLNIFLRAFFLGGHYLSFS